MEEEYTIREFLSPSGKVVTEKDGRETEGGGLLPSAYFHLEGSPEGFPFHNGRGLRTRRGNEPERSEPDGGRRLWILGDPGVFL